MAWKVKLGRFSFNIPPVAALVIAVLATFSLRLLAEINVDPLPNESIWAAVIEFIGKLQGGQYVGFLGIAAGVVYLGTVVFRTSIGANVAGVYSLALVYTLSTILLLLQGLAAGTPLSEILRNGALLGAVVNSIDQWLKHTVLKQQQEPLLQSASIAAKKKK